MSTALPLLPPKNPAFIPETFLQKAWDSTSMSLFKTCPRKYFYKMIQEWRSKTEAIPLAFGILYHSSLEAYDISRCNGESHETAQALAVKTALTLNPTFQGDDYRNPFTLVRSIVWYTEQFRDDPISTIILANNKPAVELSFRFNLSAIAPDGEPYILCGHLDKLCILNGKTWVLDRKTTKNSLSPSYFSNFLPDQQMSQYQFGANIIQNQPVSGVIIDAAQVGVSFTRFQREIIQRTPAQLDEWHRDLLLFLEQAESCAAAHYWPMNDNSCSKFGGCEFRPVCSKDPKVREIFLEADFEKAQWNPLQAR